MIGSLALVAALAGTLPANAALCDGGTLDITPDSVQVAGRPQAMTVTAHNTSGLVCNLLGILNHLLCSPPAYKASITRNGDPGGAAPTINGVSLPNAPSTANITLNFNQNGGSTASFNLDTTDVGRYYLNLEVVQGGLLCIAPLDMNGTTSAPITTRPFGLAITAIKNAANVANPSGTTATSTVFAKAGDNFQATVGAYLWAAADDANNDGVPDAGADITNNGLTPSFAGPVTLSAAAPFTPDASGGGTLGTLGGTTSPGFSGGQATVTDLTYSEVGSMTLAATAANYLSSGVNVTGTGGPVGRFIADHFTISGATLAHRGDLACPASTFTYMGESMKLDFTLTAQNAASNATANYTGAFARLDGAAAANWPAAGGSGNSGMGLAMVDTNTGVTPAVITPFPGRVAVTGTLTATWDKGVGTFSAGAVLSRPVNLAAAPSPDGPYEHIEVGIAPRDPDAVQVLPGALNLDADNDVDHVKERVKVGADFKTVRFGRLRLLNAHGSELLRLPVPLFAEFWNGSGFIKNRDDNCTPVLAPTITSHLAGAGSTSASSNGALASGEGGLWLSGPGAGSHGYVNLSLTAPDYLKYNWNGTDEGVDGNWFDDNPTGRARFGVYKNVNEFIYLRENY